MMVTPVLHDGPEVVGRYTGLLLDVNLALLPLVIALVVLAVLLGMHLWSTHERPRYRRGRNA